MNPQQVARSYAATRLAIGVVMLLFPGLAMRDILGGNDRRTKAAGRMIGVRDLVIGAGGLAEPHARPWATYGAVSDAVDTVAFLLAYRQLPRWRRGVMLLLAAGGAATGGYLVSQLDD